MSKTNANTADKQLTPLQQAEKKKSSDVEQQQMKKIEELEEKIKEKDRIIAEIRNRKQEEEQKTNNLLFNVREYNKKARQVIASYVLEIANAKRQELQKLKRYT